MQSIPSLLDHLRHACLLIALILGSGPWLSARSAQSPPNFVFILSEDNSKHYMQLYGNEHGATPAIAALGREGLVFDHAFSNAPVCSVARTTLMTGILAPRAGFQYHRKLQQAHLPEGVRMWPALLREAGYYTTNNQKKDYNVIEGEGVWDASSRQASWRHRPTPQTPFFHMQTFTTTHESSLHFDETAMTQEPNRTDAADIHLTPYQPDTPTFRFTKARYFDRIEQMDEQVGKLVKQLKEDGLLENTFIFYFGDHGGVLPRGKGYLYESGLHVPLVIRIPEAWRSRLPLKVNTRPQTFVSFIDFGPSVLHLAGLKIPDVMDGNPFLGELFTPTRLESRDEAFGYADRFDEKYEMVRSLRKGSIKYIRSFQPFYPDSLQNNYRYRMLAYQEWRQLFQEGNLNSAQSAFFTPKPAEMLFDLAADPDEVNNLASDPAHASLLKVMRERLNEKLTRINDLSFYPESHMVESALDDGIAYGQNHTREIRQYLRLCNLALESFEDAKPNLMRALRTEDETLRYWALTACSIFGEQAESFLPQAKALLKDANPLVRLRAAEFLGLIHKRDPRPTFYEILNEGASHAVKLITLNSAVLFHDRTENPLRFDVSKLDDPEDREEVKRRLDYFAGRLE